MERTVISTSARIHRRMLTLANLYTQHRKNALPLVAAPPMPPLPPTFNVDALEPLRLTYPPPLPFMVATEPPFCSSNFLQNVNSFIVATPLRSLAPSFPADKFNQFAGSPVHSSALEPLFTFNCVTFLVWSSRSSEVRA